MSTHRRLGTAALAGISVVLTAWCAYFIYRSSFVADFDGQRYFCGFDDAMISMRYAWNLAQGHGLVWNIGEHVEGYTNLLMTLWMALSAYFFEASDAVLAVQISGICVILGIGFVAMRIAYLLTEGEPEPRRWFFAVVTFASAPCFYPLAYWTLMCMETGFVALSILGAVLAAISFDRHRRWSALCVAAVCMGLAFLTRSDTSVASAVIAAYLVHSILRQGLSLRAFARIASLAAVALALPVAQLIFRVSYYDEIVPNTYTLKIAGLPLLLRLKNGVGYVIPFLGIAAVTFLVAGFSVAIRFSREKLMMLSIAIVILAYQIWAGGDPWDYWRLLAPSVPLLWILFGLEIMRLAKWLAGTEVFKTFVSRGRESSPGTGANAVFLLAVVVNMVSLNQEYLVEAFSGAPFHANNNERNVNRALAIRELTDESASMAVFWAGAVSYYSQRTSFDCLGKGDARIAQVEPDVAGGTSWNRMESVPGHNKYDLDYSIRYLVPTYVERAAWGRQWVNDFVNSEYTSFTWRGADLTLRKESPLVRWEKLPTSKRYQFTTVPKNLFRTEHIGIELGDGWEGPSSQGEAAWAASPSTIWAYMGKELDVRLTFEVGAIELGGKPMSDSPMTVVVNGSQRHEVVLKAGEIARTRIHLLEKLNDLTLEHPADRISFTGIEIDTKYMRGAAINLAAHRRAKQSSTHGDGHPARAVDERIDGVFRNRSVAETERERQPWWEVDLGTASWIDEITLWNRTDCCGDRLTNFFILVSERPIPEGDIGAARGIPGVKSIHYRGGVDRNAKIRVKLKGRYVRVQLVGRDVLSLAEVQVWQIPNLSR